MHVPKIPEETQKVGQILVIDNAIPAPGLQVTTGADAGKTHSLLSLAHLVVFRYSFDCFVAGPCKVYMPLIDQSIPDLNDSEAIISKPTTV
jgi:hypothetical protein